MGRGERYPLEVGLTSTHQKNFFLVSVWQDLIWVKDRIIWNYPVTSNFWRGGNLTSFSLFRGEKANFFVFGHFLCFTGIFYKFLPRKLTFLGNMLTSPQKIYFRIRGKDKKEKGKLFLCSSLTWSNMVC